MLNLVLVRCLFKSLYLPGVSTYWVLERIGSNHVVLQLLIEYDLQNGDSTLGAKETNID